MEDDYKPEEEEKVRKEAREEREEGTGPKEEEMYRLAEILIEEGRKAAQGKVVAFLSLLSEYIAGEHKPGVVHHRTYGELVFRMFEEQTNLTGIALSLRVTEGVIGDESFQSEETDLGEFTEVLLSYFTEAPRHPLDFERTGMNRRIVNRIEARIVGNLRCLLERVCVEIDEVKKDIVKAALKAAAVLTVRTDSLEVLFECRRLVGAAFKLPITMEDAECLLEVFEMEEGFAEERKQGKLEEVLRMGSIFCSGGEEFIEAFTEIVPAESIFELAGGDLSCIEAAFAVGTALLESESVGRSFVAGIDLEMVREIFWPPKALGVGCVEAACKFFVELLSKDGEYLEDLLASGVLKAAGKFSREGEFRGAVRVGEMIAKAVEIEVAEESDLLSAKFAAYALLPLLEGRAEEYFEMYFEALSKIGYYCKRHKIDIEIGEHIDRLKEKEEDWPEARADEINYFIEVFEEE